MDFQEIVALARDVVALCHFGYVGYRGGKLRGNLVADALHLHGAEDEETLVEFLGIEHGNVAVDDALALQPLHSLEHGRRTQVDLRGQFLDCQVGVRLQGAQDENVCGVDRIFFVRHRLFAS